METLKYLTLIGIGGAVGAILRVLISKVYSFFNITTFPIATLSVNIIGAAAIAMAYLYFSKSQNPLKHLIMPGILGGLTTFSAFSLESALFIQSQHYKQALIYILISVLGSIGITFLILEKFSAK